MNSTRSNFGSKTKSFPHQLDAINYLNSHENIALFDEQGLGKTKIVIDSLCTSMKKQDVDAALVIAPMTLVYNWEEEVRKHSHLIPIILRGTKKEKRYKYLTGANIYIVNYEAIIAELHRIKRFCKSWNKVAIVLDESARIKNHKSKTAQAIFELRAMSYKRIIISGTPVANKPFDLWSQFFFLDGGVLLGDSYDEFKVRYDDKRDGYEEKLLELQNVVEANSIRRLKKDVLELPEKHYENKFVELHGNQKRLYDKLKDELRLEVQDIKGEIIFDEADNILKKMLRLTQISSNPAMIDKSYKEVPAKFTLLDQLVVEIFKKDEKVIIWTGFIENIISLQSRFSKYSPMLLYGGVPIKERQQIVNQFQNSTDYKLLIANPAAAREGLTLTSANNAIYLDRNFNLVDYLQSQDRIHRISQGKKCTIYKLIAKNTIDEYIDGALDFKGSIASFVQGDIQSMGESGEDFLLRKQDLLSFLGG